MLQCEQILNNPNLIHDGLLVNGKWRRTEQHIPVINPAWQQILINISSASEADIKEAIETAHTAFLSWREASVEARSTILRTWYDLIIENKEDLGKIITLECGKPLAEAITEVVYGASYLEWFSEEIKHLDGDLIKLNINQRALVTRHPVGVCAAITPWNFPNAMLIRKVAPAIAAGCTVIARPSSQTPLSTLALAHLALAAGLPAGVLNVLTGDSSLIAKGLVQSNVVRKLSFTGSTEVGMQLYAQSANTMKRISLELGGNAPFIVFDDANLDNAVNGLIKSKFRNAGQTCVCANRIFVADEIYDSFLSRIIDEVKILKIGNGLDSGIEIGPLINQHAVDHAQAVITDAVEQGAKLLCGGKLHALGGTFFEPTILGDCTKNMRAFNEELFAPVIALYRFSDDDKVLELANQTAYGLASYLFTSCAKRMFKFSEKLEYGIVGVNTGIISSVKAPFGGIKHSGVGSEGSKYGLDEYLDKKYICLDLN